MFRQISPTGPLLTDENIGEFVAAYAAVHRVDKKEASKGEALLGIGATVLGARQKAAEYGEFIPGGDLQAVATLAIGASERVLRALPPGVRGLIAEATVYQREQTS